MVDDSIVVKLGRETKTFSERKHFGIPVCVAHHIRDPAKNETVPMARIIPPGQTAEFHRVSEQVMETGLLPPRCPTKF